MNFEYKISEIDSDTFRIDEQIKELHTYAYLLIGSQKAMLIDSGAGFGDMFAAVKTLTNKPVIVVHTHGHTDHFGGDSHFTQGYLGDGDFEVFCQHKDSAFRDDILHLMEKEQGLYLSDKQARDFAELKNLPDYTVMYDGDTFDIGERQIKVIASPGHSKGSVCLLEKARKTLYTGDTVCARGILLSLDYSCSVEEYLSSVKKLWEMSGLFTEMHPGHHETPLCVQIIEKFIRCAQSIIDGTAPVTAAQAAGGECLFAQYEDIGISFLKNRILK